MRLIAALVVIGFFPISSFAEDAIPQWEFKWELGLIPKEKRELIIFKADRNGALLIVAKDTPVERKKVIIRGTFENQSTHPWQYTFEIRLGAPRKQGFNRGRAVAGSGKYQTPVLKPGELHKWEIEVEVTDIESIADGAIGNVVVRWPDGKKYEDAK